MTSVRCMLLVIVLAAQSAVVRAQSASGDWTQWRGPNRDGVIPSFSEPSTWPERLNQRWKVDVGLGYASPLLAGNRLYMFARQGENEVMSALDADTGKVLWQTGYPASFTMQNAAARHGPGPKSTPILSNGRLFAIGMTGIVTAYDAATGKQVWQKPAPGNVPLYTTHAFSPLVEGRTVIFHVGGHDKGALTAFDVDTGVVRWTWDGDGPGYGSPIIAEFGGMRQIVVMTQQKLIGVAAATGELLWERPYTTSATTNAITPIIFGQTIIVSGGGQPVVAFAVARRNNQWVTDNVWENAEASYRLTNAVVSGDLLFTLATRNAGQYVGVDAKTGQTLWQSEPRQAGNAAISRAGNVFFSLEDDGELVVVRSSRTSFEPLRRYKVADTDTWAAPVISGNRIFVKDTSTLSLWTLN